MSSSFSWSKAVLTLALTGALTALTACGSPAPPAADAAGKTASAKTKDAAPAKAANAKAADKAAPKPAAKAPADKAPEQKGDQRVANYNFEKWDDKTPHRWIAEPADKVLKSAGKDKNSVCAELKPSGSDKYTVLRQRLSGNLAGKKITATLRAKASEAKMLCAKLTYETKAGPQTVVLDAAGHDSWESVTRSVSIPADAKADSAMLAVVLRPTAKKSALVDYVTITAQ